VNAVDQQWKEIQSAYAKAAVDHYNLDASPSGPTFQPATTYQSPSVPPQPQQQQQQQPVAAGSLSLQPVQQFQPRSIGGITIRQINSLENPNWTLEVDERALRPWASGMSTQSSVSSHGQSDQTVVQTRAQYAKDQYEVVATLDSGASIPVAPRSAFSDYPVIPTTASETGLSYTAISGTSVADEGEMEPIFQTAGSPTLRAGRFSAADVQKVLTSAAQVCNSGFRAVLDAWDCDSYIEEKATGERIPLRQEQGVYVYSMYVFPQTTLAHMVAASSASSGIPQPSYTASEQLHSPPAVFSRPAPR
jgi:hypothetical protein